MENGLVHHKSVGTAVLAGMVLYLLFVFIYVWFLPNYNLLRLGGRFAATTHTTFRTAIHPNNYGEQANSGVWLEKISKTTTENKRSAGFMLFGILVLTGVVFADKHTRRQFYAYRFHRGYALFAQQYAYLSLRTFRI